MAQADSCIKAGEFSLAQDFYNTAIYFCEANKDSVEKAKDALAKKIDALRKDAEAEKRKAQSLALTSAANLAIYKDGDITKGFRYAQYALQKNAENLDAQTAFYLTLYQSKNNPISFFYNHRIIDVFASSDATNFSISPNGKIICAISNGRVYFRDSETGKDYCRPVVPVLDHVGWKWQCSPNLFREERIFSSDNHGGTKESYHLAGHTESINSLSFSHDGKKICTASYDKTVKIWDNETGKILQDFKVNVKHENKETISPNGKKVCTTDSMGILTIWDSETGRLLFNIKGEKFGYNVIFSSDSKKICSTTYRNSSVWSSEDGKLLAEFYGKLAVFSPNGETICFASEEDSLKGQLQVLNCETGKLILTLQGHSRDVTSISFSPDGRKIISSSEDDTSKIWDAETGKLLLDLRGHTSVVASAEFSLDGEKVVTASWDNTIKVWDSETGELLANLQGHTDDVLMARFSSDGKKIYSLSKSKGNTLRIWNNESVNKPSDFPESDHVVF
ncbi:MAG: WD40 repeat domain-containing protein, partial [Bacteroidia bacterium]